MSDRNRSEYQNHIDVEMARLLRLFATPLLLLNIVFAAIGPFQYPEVFDFWGKVIMTGSHIILCTLMVWIINRIYRLRLSQFSDRNWVIALLVLMVINAIIYGRSGYYIYNPENSSQMIAFFAGIILTSLLSGFGLMFLRGLPLVAIGPPILIIAYRIASDEVSNLRPFAIYLIVFLIVVIGVTDRLFMFLSNYFKVESHNKTLLSAMEVKNAELDLARREANNASLNKSNFLVSIGHDLRQPLFLTQLYLEKVSAKTNMPEAKKALSTIASLNHSVGDLITVGQVNDPASLSDHVVVDCNEILAHAIEGVMPMARQLGVDIHTVPSKHAVHTDPVLLARILQNILSNALKYTRFSKVLIGVRKRSDVIKFQVWDQGPGIQELDYDKVFDSDYSKQSLLDQENSGLGLGLKTVKIIARDINADLDFKSWPGRGTVFSVKVPYAQE